MRSISFTIMLCQDINQLRNRGNSGGQIISRLAIAAVFCWGCFTYSIVYTLIYLPTYSVTKCGGTYLPTVWLSVGRTYLPTVWLSVGRTYLPTVWLSVGRTYLPTVWLSVGALTYLQCDQVWEVLLFSNKKSSSCPRPKIAQDRKSE